VDTANTVAVGPTHYAVVESPVWRLTVCQPPSAQYLQSAMTCM
jgi:hypothetical protein